MICAPPPGKKSKQALAMEARKVNAKTRDEDTMAEFVAAGYSPDDVPPFKHNEIGDLTVNELRDKVLTRLGSTSLSRYNINAYAKHCIHRVATKPEFMKLVEAGCVPIPSWRLLLAPLAQAHACSLCGRLQGVRA